MEADYIARLAQLDRRLKELNAEKEKLLKEHDSTLSTMRRTLSEKDKASREQQAKLESRIQELERMQANMQGMIKILWIYEGLTCEAMGSCHCFCFLYARSRSTIVDRTKWIKFTDLTVTVIS